MPKLDDAALDAIFRNARSYNGYTDEPVGEAELHAIWELMKWGPTSANQLPARLVWCVSATRPRPKLAECCSAQNAPKILKAPVSVIIGMDENFHEYLPELFPHTDAKSWFDGNLELRAGVGVPQFVAAGRVFHHRRARAGARYRADVRLRRRQGQRGVLRRHARR